MSRYHSILNVLGSSLTNTKSIEFDGINDRITFDSSNISFANSFAISMWINPSSVSGGFHMLWGGSGYSGGSGLGYYIYNATIKPYVSVSGSASLLFTSNPPLVVGDWFHLVLQRDAGNKWELFVNGVLDNTNTTTRLTEDLTSANTTIAKHYNASYSYGGNIDEVSVFNTALSASDISDIYNSGTPTDLSSYSSLVSWWRMGDGDTFPTLTDNGSGSVDLTMTNMDSGDIVEDVPS